MKIKSAILMPALIAVSFAVWTAENSWDISWAILAVSGVGILAEPNKKRGGILFLIPVFLAAIILWLRPFETGVNAPLFMAFSVLCMSFISAFPFHFIPGAGGNAVRIFFVPLCGVLILFKTIPCFGAEFAVYKTVFSLILFFSAFWFLMVSFAQKTAVNLLEFFTLFIWSFISAARLISGEVLVNEGLLYTAISALAAAYPLYFFAEEFSKKSFSPLYKVLLCFIIPSGFLVWPLFSGTGFFLSSARLVSLGNYYLAGAILCAAAMCLSVAVNFTDKILSASYLSLPSAGTKEKTLLILYFAFTLAASVICFLYFASPKSIFTAEFLL